MRPEDPAAALSHTGKTMLIPALICAVLSIILRRFGLFSFFFLAPLGVCAAVYGSIMAWMSFVFVLLGNAVWSLGGSLRYGTGFLTAGMDILYFTALSAGFTWIMAGNPASAKPPVRTLFRFIAASIAGALVFLGMVFSLGSDEGFSALLRSQIEVYSSAYIATSGADADQQAFLEQLLTPDRIIETFVMLTLRGGALVSAFFLFFVNRQAAFAFARLFHKQGKNIGGNDLIGFYAPRKTIWVLSLCFAAILLCRIIVLEAVEIAAWNLLVICVIMFLAQGGGIVLFRLTGKPRSMITRLLCGLLLVFIVFSPGINVLVMGGLVLLGIAENWLSLRVKKQEVPD
jgi:hypothetical protein